MVVVVERWGGSKAVGVDAVDSGVGIVVVRCVALLEVTVVRGGGISDAVARSDGGCVCDFVTRGWVWDASHRGVLERQKISQSKMVEAESPKAAIIVNEPLYLRGSYIRQYVHPETDGVVSAVVSLALEVVGTAIERPFRDEKSSIQAEGRNK